MTHLAKFTLPFTVKVALAASAALFIACATPAAQAAEAGWRTIQVAASASGEPAVPVALYYPTAVAARALPMGPYTPQVAPFAPPDAKVKGLILLSHGTGGTDLGHTSLAEALARAGYLVAALRHPGDDWQDQSLRDKTPERYFTVRPQQARRVIDALLSDPAWKDRIARDAQGPMVGALGHSAGGYTVLALAGGQPDLARLARHCAIEREQDPVLCSHTQRETAASPPGPSAVPSAVPSAASETADPRVRAVLPMSPMGVVLTSESLARVRIPVAVYYAEKDTYLVPRFHAQWITANLPGAESHRVDGAGHFAFMDTPAMSIQSADGDIAANPPGFDRAAFLKRMSVDVVAFFDRQL